MGGGARVLAGLERRARDLHPLREARGEALVVHLHRDGVAEASRELSGEGARLACLLGVAAVERQWQADDHALDLALARELAQLREAALGGGTRDRVDGCDDRAGGVAQRAAAARAAVVEREHPHQPASAASIVARPVSMASARRSGSRPPACASVSRPPPPPPTTSAARLTIAPAFTPRSTSSGATLATRCTRPSAAVPSRIAEPGRRPLSRSSTSSSALASATSTATASTLAPPASTAVAASASTSTPPAPPFVPPPSLSAFSRRLRSTASASRAPGASSGRVRNWT